MIDLDAVVYVVAHLGVYIVAGFIGARIGRMIP